VKFRLISALILAGLLAVDAASAQNAAAPATPPPPGTLAPVEKLAEDAQRQLFNEADKFGGSGAVGNYPTSPVTSSSGGRKSFKALPAGSDPTKWEKDSRHKIAVMEVSIGGDNHTVMFELFPQDAPRTVSNFLDNCESGSYKGLAFHRAIPGFLVQTGDPLTADDGNRDRWGTGGNSKTVPAEIKRQHRRGAVAMGRRNDSASRASNGYQFYFALGNYGSLDGNYTVFGQVVSGIDVLEKISKTPVDNNDCPIARIEIKSMKIIDQIGPLFPSVADSGDGRKMTKPRAAKGFFERALERVW
jgi:cyclophilin family peptidyl-prolyl cis-trans isomerase